MGLDNFDQENFILDYFSKDWNNDKKRACKCKSFF